MATGPYRADLRDIEFVLFEHLQMEKLFQLPEFSDHSIETVKEMLLSANAFSEHVLSPLNKIGDRVGCKHNKETKEVTTPPGTKEAYKDYVEKGYIAVTEKSELGGLQAPNLIQNCLSEVFCAANCAFIMYPALSRSAAHVLESHGAEWMKKICPEKVFSGSWTGSMCLTEPSAGSAVGDLKTTAKRNGDSFLIRGTKQWISGGEHDLAENILHLVLARIEGAPQGMDGVSLFLVPKKRFNKDTGAITGDNDVFCISLEEKMGIHGNATCLMQFGDKNNCEGYLVGEENKGIMYMFLMMNEARIAVGIQGLAQASAAFLNAESYAKERVQGVDFETKKDGANSQRVTIVNHPDVRRMLLRQRSLVEGMRALCYKVALLYDESKSLPDEKQKHSAHNQLELLTPVVKSWCSDMGFNSIVLSLQTFGGYGFTKDYPIEQILRDSKIASIYEGTNGIQSLDFVGRKMRMEDGKVFMGWIEQYGKMVEKNKANAELAKEFALLEKHIAKLAEGAMLMNTLGKDGKKRQAILNSYSYMMAFGHITVCGMLLEQALIAQNNLTKKLSEKEGKFYRNKIKTAKFFANNILPEADAYLKTLLLQDTSCLDFEFA